MHAPFALDQYGVIFNVVIYVMILLLKRETIGILFCFYQQMPVILAGNEAQKKKYLGRMTEEPLMCVSMCHVK